MDNNQIIIGYFMIFFILLCSIGGAFCYACNFNREDQKPLISNK